MSQPNGDCKFLPNKPGKDGYVRLHRNKGNKIVYAHVQALEKKLGRPLRDGYEASHTCHNRACINEDHLIEETHQENVRRSWDEGRCKSNWLGGHRAVA